MISPQILAEYAALTQQVGYVDFTPRTKLELRGADAPRFLHNFCTQEMMRLPVGSSIEAFVCNAKGHLLGHVQAIRTDDAIFIDTSPHQAERLLPHWDRYILRDKVELIDHTTEFAAIGILGPDTKAWMDRLPSVADSLVFSSSFPQPDSLLLWFPVAQRETWEQWLAATNIARCSAEAFEMVRIEAGYPLYGIDINHDRLPQEVDRNRQAISFQKGCYLGQETVARIDALGHVNHLLRGLATSSPPAFSELDPKQVQCCSRAWSPVLNRYLALGYVRREHAAPGTKLGDVEVVALPVAS